MAGEAFVDANGNPIDAYVHRDANGNIIDAPVERWVNGDPIVADQPEVAEGENPEPVA